jgi:hypothetical protein
MKLLAFLLLAAAPDTGLVGLVSSPLNDYNLSVDRSERVMVFGRSEAEFRNAKIYISERQGMRWGKPRPVDFSDKRYSDSDPWLTPDGRTLYFISDRPAPDRKEGRSDYDIWRSRWVNGIWSAPVRLGSAVNGPGQELGPELHGNMLFFSSARRSGIGGLDIYQARVNGDDFKQAELLQGPFNTAASESDFTVNVDGSAAMFWRSIGERASIHISYRQGAGWSQPVPLPANINAGPFNFTPSFSRSGKGLRYATTLERLGQPSGFADIYEKELPSR